MKFSFELFGFYIDKRYDVKTFWVCSFCLDRDEPRDWNLFLIGIGQGRFMFEILGKWMCGPKTLF